jgi:uncharacterized surface anchored protein
VTVTYTGHIKEGAAVYDVATNEAKVDYKNIDQTNTKEDETKHHTWKADFIKKDGMSNAFLKGAKFYIYDTADEANTALTAIQGGGTATKDTSMPAGTQEATSAEADGKFAFYGLKPGKMYYVVEVEAPAGGYLVLNHVISFTTGTPTLSGTTLAYPTGYTPNPSHARMDGMDIRVDNNKERSLPGTGGHGKVAVFVLAAVFVVIAGVLYMRRDKEDSEA